MFEQAKEKLQKELKNGKFDRYGTAMKEAVCEALLEFCRQDEEFAQAVVQGGSFADCMAAVTKKIKSGSISDMEAFGAAVSFYFPGAGIQVKMTIDLCAGVREAGATAPEEKAGGIVIDLSDFFD